MLALRRVMVSIKLFQGVVHHHDDLGGRKNLVEKNNLVGDAPLYSRSHTWPRRQDERPPLTVIYQLPPVAWHI